MNFLGLLNTGLRAYNQGRRHTQANVRIEQAEERKRQSKERKRISIIKAMKAGPEREKLLMDML